MLKHPDITLERADRFVREFRARCYPERRPLELSVYSALERITYGEAMRGPYRPAKLGEKFGPAWSTHWFKLTGHIPREWQGREVHLRWNSYSEACLWKDGVPLQGFADTIYNSPTEPIRTEYLLTRSAAGGEPLAFAVEMAVSGLGGCDPQHMPPEMGRVEMAEIAVFDREAWDLYWDVVTVRDLGRYLPEKTLRRNRALAVLHALLNACDADDRSTWPGARRLAAEFLGRPNSATQLNLSAVGHAHIDSAWLWPRAETKRKCVRTFSAALRLMEQYPEYKFACSQAQQLAWMKVEQPELYQQILARVREGRFVPVGGTWVEPDCNLPSGESLVRQFLHGQRFFREEFGRCSTVFWNPDVFGYNAQLPQIMAGAGIRYFLTLKLGWNQFNKLPSHTFLWEGLDGTRILTHFPPADTYNAFPDVKTLLYTVENFRDQERAGEAYLLFGFGDGGGGPTAWMLEQARRARDCEGLPRVEMRAPEEFFQRCADDVQTPLVWQGELYFERHRGTYTTQAANKRDNRRAEFLLRDVELFATLAMRVRKFAYPTAELDRLWKLVLFNQFHDILPGSSIREVYADCARDYAEILESAEKLREEAIASLTGHHAPGKHLLVVNSLDHSRTEVVELPEAFSAGRVASAQPKAADGRALGVVEVPAMGYAVLARCRPAEDKVTLKKTAAGVLMENQALRVEVSRNGRLLALFDKRLGREALAAGEQGNRLVLFDDLPANWDAWDVEIYHLEQCREVVEATTFTILESGPLRAMVEITAPISQASRLRQRISLSAHARRVEFDTEVDWHEKNRFLKVEFPVNVRCEYATYETQFGHVRRPTHFNTSWDVARFEVCAHRWMDFSEPGFGVAVLNDCKYGHAVHGQVMRLSLLRAPKMPDPEADMGSHRFRYAVLTHGGDFRAAGVVQEGYAFNNPLRITATATPVGAQSFFAVDNPALVLDTVKKAEDSSAVIVRLYEAHGRRGTARLSSRLPFKKALRCNLLEEHGEALKWEKGGVAIAFRPFEIVTLKLM